MKAPLSTFETLNPPYLEAGRDDDLHDARYWALHLPATDLDNVRALADRFLRTGAENLTGDWCGGDSYSTWGEACVDPDDSPHLAVYYKSTYEGCYRDAAILMQRAGLLIPALPIKGQFVVSTALDWAMQVGWRG